MKKNILLATLIFGLTFSHVANAQSGNSGSAVEATSLKDFNDVKAKFEKATNTQFQEADIADIQAIMRKGIESSKAAIANSESESKEANSFLDLHMKRANLYNELIVALRKENRSKTEILSILNQYAATL